MNPDIKRQFVSESIIYPNVKREVRPNFGLSLARNGMDRDTFRLVVETINAGSNMFDSSQNGDQEAEVLFQGVLKWGGARDDIYFACKDKKIDKKLPIYFQTYYPEYLYFLAQDAKKNPCELVTFSVDKSEPKPISLRKIDLLRLVLTYANHPLADKRLATGI